MPGIGDGIIPPNLDLSLHGRRRHRLDAGSVGDRAPSRPEEGLLCGPSSGINVAAAHKVAAAHPELRRIVTVVCDTGQRYLSGELFGERAEVEEPDRDHTIEPPRPSSSSTANRDRLEFIA